MALEQSGHYLLRPYHFPSILNICHHTGLLSTISNRMGSIAFYAGLDGMGRSRNANSIHWYAFGHPCGDRR